MSNDSARLPPGDGMAQPQPDTQRLTAVELRVTSLETEMLLLRTKHTDTRRTLDLLRVMVEGIVTSQGAIRESLGQLAARDEKLVPLIQLLDERLASIEKKIDRRNEEKGNA